ncbi:glutaredoxin family protein [Methanothrix sp.]|uniref:glutaredoxin family protein n=1 Tax=Methanothrix sp. TaxID=90426 RepID=UPI002BA24C84|nr:glutaredoxin family protein [Methanothrix sp.]HOL43886.1 glutaredoxin family protein [Methanothrix sp.]HPO88946.1 glutaredoxin family protein [Methanothrix sp.]
MGKVHVDGQDAGDVTLYALSTCMWCKKTRDLLSKLGVGHDYVYVDLTSGAERAGLIDELRRFNPDLTFPTLVVNGKVIIGYREKEIKSALGVM